MAAVDNEIVQQIFIVSVIVSAVFCRLHGREFAPPRPDYSYIENILHMMRFVEPATGKPDPRVRRALKSPPPTPAIPPFQPPSPAFTRKRHTADHVQVVKLLNRTMILMADHEITNSASVLLNTASTMADPYSCCAAATLSGIGILHGGAIEVAYKQLEAVRDLREVPVLIEAVKSGKMRLFGYGHRKWKVSRRP